MQRQIVLFSGTFLPFGAVPSPGDILMAQVMVDNTTTGQETELWSFWLAGTDGRGYPIPNSFQPPNLSMKDAAETLVEDLNLRVFCLGEIQLPTADNDESAVQFREPIAYGTA